jgi:hypothetical protein
VGQDTFSPLHFFLQFSNSFVTSKVRSQFCCWKFSGKVGTGRRMGEYKEMVKEQMVWGEGQMMKWKTTSDERQMVKLLMLLGKGQLVKEQLVWGEGEIVKWLMLWDKEQLMK